MSENFVPSPGQAAERLARVRALMAEAAVRSGRDPGDVRLLAVSKTFPAQAIRVYIEAGLNDFGESYIQEAREKADELSAAHGGPEPHWHFIGHLQTNKAKYAAALFQSVHSLDSVDLALALDKRAAALGRTINVYIEVNIAGEDSKSGLAPEELPRVLEGLAECPALRAAGLMTIPPYNPDPERSRRYFAALRALKERVAPDLPGLSMGMSGDFQVAIEEGSTVVRVGTALFGPRAG